MIFYFSCFKNFEKKNVNPFFIENALFTFSVETIITDIVKPFICKMVAILGGMDIFRDATFDFKRVESYLKQQQQQQQQLHPLYEKKNLFSHCPLKNKQTNKKLDPPICYGKKMHKIAKKKLYEDQRKKLSPKAEKQNCHRKKKNNFSPTSTSGPPWSQMVRLLSMVRSHSGQILSTVFELHPMKMVL